jgi:CBS domain containing-hemolysin-like protein
MLLASSVIAGLILVTALYVAAEFAAVGVRRSKLRRLADDGSVLAARLLPYVEDGRRLDRYIAASQIGITLSSLVLGAYGQARLAPVVAQWLAGAGLHASAAASYASAAVLAVLTVLGVILGELVPKSLALQYTTQTALVTVLPMQWSLRLFAPFIALLNGSGLLLLRLFGLRGSGHRHIHSPEEIDLLIAESRDGGLLEPDEEVRLHRALRLGRRRARDLMVPRARLAAIPASLTLAEALAAAAESPYTRLLVHRGSLDDVAGIVRTKDLVLHYLEHGADGSLAALLRPVVRVREDLPADRLLAVLRERRAHQALVVDGAGHVAGLVALEDVLAALLGPTADEFKEAGGGPRRG